MASWRTRISSWTSIAEVNPVMGQHEKRDLTLKRQSSATKEEDLLQQGQNVTKSRRCKRGVASCCSKTGGCLWTTEEEQGQTSPLIILGGKEQRRKKKQNQMCRRNGTVVSSRWPKDSSYPRRRKQGDFPWINQVVFVLE